MAAVIFGAIALTVLTETTKGIAPSLSALEKVFRSGSKNFAGYPQRSVVNSFPFVGDIAWRRYQIRSQVHLSGHTDMRRLPAFFDQKPLIFHSLGEHEATFAAEEPGVHIMGKVNMATTEAEIVCLAVETPLKQP